MIDIYRWAIGFVGSIFAITVVKLIFDVLYGRFKKIKFNLLSKFGQKSLQIYVLQMIVLGSFSPLVYRKIVELCGTNFLINNMVLYNFVITPIIALLAGLCCLLIIYLFDKLKISKIIFGR